MAVADKEDPKGRTEAEKNEPVLTVGMIRVVDKERVVVDEDGGGFSEGDTVPAPVETVLCGVPLETKSLGHAYIVVTKAATRQSGLTSGISGERSESAACRG